MNATQRVLKTFNREKTDRIPIYTHVDSVAAIETITGAKFETDPLGITVDAIKAFGIDLTTDICLPSNQTINVPLYPNDKKCKKCFVIKTDNYSGWIESRPFANEEEAYEWARSNWKVRSHQENLDIVLPRIEKRVKNQALLGDSCMLIHQVDYTSFEAIFHHLSFETFSCMMYEEPELLSDIMKVMLENAYNVNQLIIEQDPTPVVRMCDDLAFKTGPLVSPDWMREEFFPKHKVLTDALHSAGIKVLFHSCGNVTKILPDIIAAGADAIQPLEITAGCDLKQIKKDYGDKLVIMGNVDTNLIKLGTEEEVRRDVRRCIDDAAYNGGYFMEAAGGFSDAGGANVLAFFDEAIKYGTEYCRRMHGNLR